MVEVCLLERMAQIYCDIADDYLEKGEYLSAVQALTDGVKKTGNEALAEREAYLREHIVVVNKKEYYDDGIAEYGYEYDESGNKIKTAEYNGDGSLGNWYDCELDIMGNIINRRTDMRQSNVVYEYQYIYIGE